jgi:hypothetical protein
VFVCAAPSFSSYSKIYHSDIQILNQFIKKSLDAYKVSHTHTAARDAALGHPAPTGTGLPGSSPRDSHPRSIVFRLLFPCICII